MDIQSLDCLSRFLLCKISLAEVNRTTCMKVIVVLFFFFYYKYIIALMNIIQVIEPVNSLDEFRKRAHWAE